MLYRLFTGKISIVTAAIIIALSIIKFTWKHHNQEQEKSEALMNQLAPALSKMSPEEINDSDWHYSGSLGELDIHFNSDGTLVATSGSNPLSGSWSISGHMLTASISGIDSPLQGAFRDSTDEIVGPEGSASRLKTEQGAAANP
jgi:hypothetical protein